jgi:hypothetical protein
LLCEPVSTRLRQGFTGRPVHSAAEALAKAASLENALAAAGSWSRHTHIEGMKNPSELMIVKSRRAGAVLVCKKCLKRADDGKIVKRRLKAELKHRNGENGKRRRAVLTGCFGICPKHAVVMASGRTLARGEFLLVSDRNSISDAADVLLRDQD